MSEKIQRFDSWTKANAETSLHDAMDRLINGYPNAKKEMFTKHEFGTFVRKALPEIIYKTGLVSKKHYLITGSVGQTNWAMIPWIGIFDRSITTSARKGIYIVYLLSKNGEALYLTFNQGCEDIKSSHTKNETIQILRERAEEIASSIDLKDFKSDENINLGDGLTDLGDLYQKGTIFYKKYEKGKLPSEEELQADLQKMMEIYQEYALVREVWETSLAEYDPGISTQVWYELLNCTTIFSEKALWMMAAYYDMGGQASCLELESKYGQTVKDYQIILKQVAQQIMNETKCPLPPETENYKGWPIIFVRQKAREEVGDYIWKLRPELYEALKEFGIEKYLGKGIKNLTVKGVIKQIKNYITAKGFSYPKGLIENFYLSLKSKPFVILAGISGTGKTRLVQLFAEAAGATNDNGRYKMVSVRPDWSDSTDLFGHVNLYGNFIPGEILDFVKKAETETNKPFFLCLDEMNLARVEYYLSDVLSVLETREKQADGTIKTIPLMNTSKYGLDHKAVEEYGTILLPENLYIIGTVNMDETTFPFSRKVLDRANTIEFSYVDLIPNFLDEATDALVEEVSNIYLKTEYLVLTQDCKEEEELVQKYCLELQKMNDILQIANAHVGYRVRDEIIFYLLNNKKAGLLNEEEAFDNEILQKILPRVQGSSTTIKIMLCDLFRFCAGDYEEYQTDDNDISSKMLKLVLNKDKHIRFKRSAEKIAFMVRRYEEDGFTTYWL